MLLEGLRRKVVEMGQRLLDSGLVQGTGGNVSALDAERGLFAISPSGRDYRRTRLEDVAVMDMAGNQVAGDCPPSSEVALHGRLYRNRKEFGAVIHTHSLYCTALATLRQELPPISPLVALAGGNVRCAGYAPFGSRELAKLAVAAMEDRNAALLANHGLLVASKDLEGALSIAVQLEHCAQVYLVARAAGQPVLLSDEQLQFAVGQFRNYGK